MWYANSGQLMTKELQRFQNSTPNFLVEKCCLRHFRQVDSGLPYNSAPPPPRPLKTLPRNSSRRDEKSGTIKIWVADRSKTRYGKLPPSSSLTLRQLNLYISRRISFPYNSPCPFRTELKLGTE